MKTLIYFLAFGCILFCVYSFYNSEEIEPINNSSNDTSIQDSAPKERREYFELRRGGEVDLDKINIAKKIVGKEIDKMVQQSRDGQINGWQSLGPGNIGGRVRALAIHPTTPSTIFAGSASGGIWKTTNTGASWSISNSNLDSYPVMDIIFHPTNTNIIYAVTGEFKGTSYPGVGVLRSVNGGTSWSIMNQPPTGDFKYLSKIRFHPTNNNIMYAAGAKPGASTNSDGVVYESTDGGINWSEIWTESLSSSTNVYDMEIIEDGIWKLAIGTGHRAYYSSAGSSTFNVIDLDISQTIADGYTMLRHEVQACKSDPDILYIQRYLTKDTIVSGDTLIIYKTELWKSTTGVSGFMLETSTSNVNGVNILGTQGDYDNVLWVNPVNCDQVLMGGIEMYRYESGDNAPTQISDGDDDIGANSWESLNNSIHVDQHVIVESPNFNNSSNALVYIGNDGGVYGTSDVNNAQLDPNDDPTINTTWFSLVSSMEITQFYGGDISYDGNTAVGGSQDNHYIFDNNVSDQTQTWNTYSRGDGGFCRIDKSDNNKFYTTTQYGTFYKTEDGGQTFCNTFKLMPAGQSSCCGGCGYYISASDSALFIAPMEMSPSNNDHLYIGGTQLYKSDEPGTNWYAMTNLGATSKISAIAVAANTEDTLWFGKENGSLYNTFNDGANWNLINIEDSLGINLNLTTDIAIHPKNSNLVAATFGGFLQTHIYITKDGGQSWEAKPLGFDMQVNTVTWMPELEEVLYVGTDIGVFASEDQGDTWSVMPYLPNGEGPVYVSTMELFWQGDGSSQYPLKLCAATYGRGMWRTSVPIYTNLYVDKNCNPCGNGTLSSPFRYFAEAVEEALPGSEITFLSSGTHDEIAPNIIVDKKLKITISSSIIIR